MPTYPIQLEGAPTYRRRLTFVNDDDGIKTSIATAATVQTYTGAALNGALCNPSTFAKLENVARTFRAVLAANAGSYVAGSTIVVTGTFAGSTVTDTVTIVGTDGTETLDGTQRFDTFTSIVVAAQVNAGGAFTFGVAAVKPQFWIRKIRMGLAGNIIATGGDGIQNTTALLDSNIIEGADVSIDAGTTGFPITIFM